MSSDSDFFYRTVQPGPIFTKYRVYFFNTITMYFNFKITVLLYYGEFQKNQNVVVPEG